MSTIIKYIVRMMPYMFISIPIYLVIRFIILKSRNKNINWYHEAALFIFVIFIVGLASQTIIPKIEITATGSISILKARVHTTNLIPFKVLYETYIEVFVNRNVNYFLINFLGNIIMFMPIGFFVILLFNISKKQVILIGFCSSLFIEVSQIFLSRGTDVDDLMLNTIGVILGLLVYEFLYKCLKDSLLKYRNNSV